MSIHTCIYTRGTRTPVAPAPVRAHTHTCTGRRTANPANPANLGSSVSRWCSFKEHLFKEYSFEIVLIQGFKDLI